MNWASNVACLMLTVFFKQFGAKSARAKKYCKMNWVSNRTRSHDGIQIALIFNRVIVNDAVIVIDM